MVAHEVGVELSPRPASAAEARRFVARALRALDARDRDVAILLASELVTNALLYAQGRITLRVTPLDDRIRVSVTDGSHTDVHPRRVSPDATSGRGLALVEQLSAAWGVELITDDGKEVWFELPSG
jgi:anti-sigma regulatory factor (Ser/Thr protein kinase)